MIDPAGGQPKRRLPGSKPACRTRYPCSVCRRNLVRKKGGRCRRCASKEREERLKVEGTNRYPATLTGRGRPPKNKVRCAAHWKIEAEVSGHEIGKCAKAIRRDGATMCEDTGLPCPFNGVRDFTKLQGRTDKEIYTSESNRKGGEISGRRRGRPRKSRG